MKNHDVLNNLDYLEIELGDKMVKSGHPIENMMCLNNGYAAKPENMIIIDKQVLGQFKQMYLSIEEIRALFEKYC